MKKKREPYNFIRLSIHYSMTPCTVEQWADFLLQWRTAGTEGPADEGFEKDMYMCESHGPTGVLGIVRGVVRYPYGRPPVYYVNEHRAQYSLEDLKVINKLGLTITRFRQFDESCHMCYRAIGDDLAAANENKDIRRRDLMEMVCDADRILQYDPRPRSEANDPDKRGEWREFYNGVLLPLIQQHWGTPFWSKVTKVIFPEKAYGV